MVNIKGSAILTSMNLARQTHGESGLKKVLDSLRNEDREVLSSVMSTGWYSLDAYVNLLSAELRDFCQGNELEFLEQRVFTGVEQQFKMIYKIFLQFRGPEQIMSRLNNINKQYFQGVSTEVRKIDENKFLLIYKGFEARHWGFRAAFERLVDKDIGTDRQKGRPLSSPDVYRCWQGIQ